jgi:hypothetical protein
MIAHPLACIREWPVFTRGRTDSLHFLHQPQSAGQGREFAGLCRIEPIRHCADVGGRGCLSGVERVAQREVQGEQHLTPCVGVNAGRCRPIACQIDPMPDPLALPAVLCLFVGRGPRSSHNGGGNDQEHGARGGENETSPGEERSGRGHCPYLRNFRSAGIMTRTVLPLRGPALAGIGVA